MKKHIFTPPDAVFALERIRDWERDYLTDDLPNNAVREWLGHVSPALEQLERMIANAERK